METSRSHSSYTSGLARAVSTRKGIWGIVLVLALSIAAGGLARPGTAFAADSGGLSSPTVPLASDTFTWTVGGSSSSPLRSVSLTGCWSAGQVASVTASSGRALVNSRTGAITVSGGKGITVPLTISVRYVREYQSRSGITTLGYAEGGSSTSFQVSGPNCQPPAPPDAPTGISAAQHDNSTELSWTSPSSNGGVITGYAVSCDPACPSTASGLTTHGATSTRVSGLTYGQSYTFRVAATNRYGTGAASAASNAVVFATTPGVPTAVVATQHGGYTTVGWTAPSSNGGSAIVSYAVSWASPLNSGSAITDGAATSTRVSGLTYGQSYTFRVAAMNRYGRGGASDASNAITFAAAPGAPGGVATMQGDNYTELSWTAPSGNGSAITGYAVSCNPACPSTASGLGTDGATTSTRVSGLTYGQSYTFRVAATNNYGTGAASVASNAVVFAATPGAPRIVSATGAEGRAAISWLPSAGNGSAITAYGVRVYLAGTDALVKEMLVDPSACGTSCSATVSGLTDGTTYDYTIGATNGYGAGPVSGGTVTVIGPPGVPRIGYALAGDGYVALGWSATSDGGQPIAYYTVTIYECTPVTDYVPCSPVPSLDYNGDIKIEQRSGWSKRETKQLNVGSSPYIYTYGGDYEWPLLENGTRYVFAIRASNFDYVSLPAMTRVITPYEGAGGCKVGGRLIC